MKKKILLVCTSLSKWENLGVEFLSHQNLDFDVFNIHKNLDSLCEYLKEQKYDGLSMLWCLPSWLKTIRQYYFGPIAIVTNPSGLNLGPQTSTHYFDSSKAANLAYTYFHSKGVCSYGFFGIENTIECDELLKEYLKVIEKKRTVDVFLKNNWVDTPLAKKA